MLDFDKVRAFYFDHPSDDPERIPSREEIYARYERERFERCLLRGGDPEVEGLGPHGSLIGGRPKPLTLFHGFPELRAQPFRSTRLRGPSTQPRPAEPRSSPGSTSTAFVRASEVPRPLVAEIHPLPQP